MEVETGHKKTYKKKGEGGMVMGIRKELLEKGTEMAVEQEGIMMGYVKQGREGWRIVGVYVSGDIEQKLKKMERWIKDKAEGVKTIMGRENFNARIGEEGGEVVEGNGMEKDERRRKSKHKSLDREGRILVEFIEEREWCIYNEVHGTGE